MFLPTDSWPDWAKKLGDWGLKMWNQRVTNAKWDSDHPGCTSK